MKQHKSSQGLIGTGVVAAIAASLCCITPVLAFVAGASGVATTFSWLEPARPYLIGLTVIVLGFAWYQKLIPITIGTMEEIECACEDDEKPKFIQSKLFLGIVTVFAALMLAFPLYADIFYPRNEKQVMVVDKADIQTVEFTISGMTCNACAEHVKHQVNQLDGIVEANASYEDGNSIVEFDRSKTTIPEIEKAINSTGYRVTDQKQK